MLNEFSGLLSIILQRGRIVSQRHLFQKPGLKLKIWFA